MFGFNEVMLLGTIVAKPELRENNSGKYCFLRVAQNYRQSTDRETGAKITKQPSFYNIVFNGPLAEAVCNSAEKGDAFAAACELDLGEGIQATVDGKERVLYDPKFRLRGRFEVIHVAKKTKTEGDASTGEVSETAADAATASAPATNPEDDFGDGYGHVTSYLPF